VSDKGDDKLSRLSDHFHKIRITTILLSTSLLLCCISKGTGALSLFLSSYTPDAESYNFILVMLGLAVLVSASHMALIWFDERRKLELFYVDAQAVITASGQMIEIANATSSQLLSACSTNSEIFKRIGSTDTTALRRVMEEHLGEEAQRVAKTRIIQDIRGLEHFSFHFPEMHNDAEAVVNKIMALSSITDNERRDFVSDQLRHIIESSWANKLGNIRMERESWIRIEEMAKNAAERVAMEMQMLARDIPERTAPAFSDIIIAEKNQTTSIKNFMESANTNLETVKNTIPSVVSSLKQLRRALNRSSRSVKAIIWIYDLTIPLIAALIAELHLVGFLFFPVIPSAPRVFNLIQRNVSAHGWVSSIAALVLISATAMVWVRQMRLSATSRHPA